MEQHLFQPSTRVATLPSDNTLLLWKILQALFWLIGIVLLLIMFFAPPVGVTLFWNILIPVAPALLVVGTGIWRNVCPLGTTALLPDKTGLSKKIKLSSAKQTVFQLIGVILLMLIIPLRHVIFNISGQATALIILFLAVPALLMGFIYERKSGWCSGLCPVHPVEKLYGSGVAFSLPNAHCNECVKCSVPCPDSTPNNKPFSSRDAGVTKATEILLVGGFPGYVWGWFQVPDFISADGWQNLFLVYGYPFLGAAVSIGLFILLTVFFERHQKRIISSLFAATAVSFYYWFRLPVLFGFGELDTNGMLVDLSNSLPGWSMTLLTLITTVFFFWWMVFHKKRRTSWSVRPEYAGQ
ncbi:MAG TPA: hypothetical protein VI548_00595 [Chitinophagaceae bacterium]|nr:hypothetical protein [Chitinophagaceae bacterium]